MPFTRAPQTAPEPELSVVIPVYNEAANVPLLLERLKPVLDSCVASWEILFVDDGSSDGSLDALRAARAQDARIDAISFSRNFGKEIAIAAGLDAARGAGVVLMDSDLQHPPETISAFVERWREGYQNVYGQRTDRGADTPLRRALTRRFYRMFARLGETPLPPGAGDFRLLDRKVVEALKEMREQARFSKGLYAWVGFRSVGVPFDVAERASGYSKFSYRKLTRFALDGLMSFSTAPLEAATFVGILISVFALTMAAYYLLHALVSGIDVPGFASLIVSIMFFAGIQLLSLGVIGEYIGRIFAEVKRRPLYIVAERLSSDEGEGPA